MPKYRIESTGNGAFFFITRLADDSAIMIQGDDAVIFGRILANTHDKFTDDDLAAEYFGD